MALVRLPEIRFAGLVACFIGAFCGMSILWTQPQAILAPADRPVGIAFVSSCGILASMATPPLIGYLVDLTHSFVPGLLLLAGVLAVASSLIWMVDRRPQEARRATN